MTSPGQYKRDAARFGCKPPELKSEGKPAGAKLRLSPRPPRCGPGIQEDTALENMLFCHSQPESYHQHSASYIR